MVIHIRMSVCVFACSNTWMHEPIYVSTCTCVYDCQLLCVALLSPEMEFL